ncbi:tRNA epoxyqueuosine(34) reductase QueG [Marinilabiliaceae bacterium JC017]|nr:tRNA epoxyqueuosine(34) reductase QueG [Marinilabiliaceae bacterium JC017]
MDIIALKYQEMIREEALRLGFSDIGFAPVEHLCDDELHLKQWLNDGFQAGMEYMNNHFEKRVNPSLLVEGARSVISLLVNYKPDQKQRADVPQIATYAFGKDYHFTLKEKMQVLFDFIKANIFPQLDGRCFVDSAPVLDRAWAVKSGLGWIGKNTNLIHRKHGSYVFIGELITNLALPATDPIKAACGNCTRCIDACPTGALVAPYRLDANKCISFQTIENRGEIPEQLVVKFQNRVYGCDICQEVCPWNRKTPPTREADFMPHPDLLTMTREQWYALDESTYREIFRKSAVKRAKYAGLMRNLAFLKKAHGK